MGQANGNPSHPHPPLIQVALDPPYITVRNKLLNVCLRQSPLGKCFCGDTAEQRPINLVVEENGGILVKTFLRQVSYHCWNVPAFAHILPASTFLTVSVNNWCLGLVAGCAALTTSLGQQCNERQQSFYTPFGVLTWQNTTI